MSQTQTSFDDLQDDQDEQEPTGAEAGIAHRLEGFVNHGQPTCSVCYHLDPDDRPADGEFFPERPIRYIRAGESVAVEWNPATVCEHHDTPEHIPAGVTHRVVTTTEYIGDEHRMNSAYANHVETIEGIDR